MSMVIQPEAGLLQGQPRGECYCQSPSPQSLLPAREPPLPSVCWEGGPSRLPLHSAEGLPVPGCPGPECPVSASSLASCEPSAFPKKHPYSQNKINVL